MKVDRQSPAITMSKKRILLWNFIFRVFISIKFKREIMQSDIFNLTLLQETVIWLKKMHTIDFKVLLFISHIREITVIRNIMVHFIIKEISVNQTITVYFVFILIILQSAER